MHGNMQKLIRWEKAAQEFIQERIKKNMKRLVARMSDNIGRPEMRKQKIAIPAVEVFNKLQMDQVIIDKIMIQ